MNQLDQLVQLVQLIEFGRIFTHPNEVCIGVAVSVKNICARFITVLVKKLLHYRAGGLLQYRTVLLHYRAVTTVSGVFITLSGSYYSIGRLLHYRLVQLLCYVRKAIFAGNVMSVVNIIRFWSVLNNESTRFFLHDL